MKRILASFLYTCASFLFLLLITLSLLVSTYPGNSWLWRQLCQQLPALDGQLVSGNVWRGWTFENLSWTDEQVDFQADRVDIQWQLDHLLERHLEVTRLEISKPVIRLLQTDSSSTAEPEGSSPSEQPFSFVLNISELLIQQLQFASDDLNVSLEQLNTDLHLKTVESSGSELPPLALKLSELLIQQLRLTSGNANISLSQLNTDLQLEPDALVINQAAMAQLLVNLAETEEASQPQTETITLPEINLPVPISLHDLELADFTFEQGAFKESIPSLSLALNAQEDRLEQVNLQLSHPWADVSVDGTLQLSQDYPLSLNSRINLHKNPRPDILIQKDANLRLSGSLAQLGIDLETHGTANAELTGTVHPLSPDLPFDLNLSWQPLQWPEGFPLPDLSLQAGRLSAKGDMNHYQLQLATALQVPDKPRVQVAMTADGDFEQLTVHNLTATAGKNQLVASGTLASTVAIEASLEADNLNDLYPGLEGSLQSRFKLAGNADKARLSYQLQSPGLGFNQHSLTGLHSSGELRKDQWLDGQLSLSIEELESGETRLQQLSLTANGSERSHSLSLSVDGSPVSGHLKLDGSWKNDLWTASLKQSTIKTPVGDWALTEPVDISINSHQQAAIQTTSQARIAAHCWHSVSDTKGQTSELCLKPSQISADSGQSSFTLTAFSPDRLSGYFPAGFQWQALLGAEGNIAWQDQTPKIDLNIASSPGQLTMDELTSDYETLSLKLSLTQEEFNGSLDFQSWQLGQAKVNLKVKDPEHERALEGQFNIENLLLSSFATFIPEVSSVDGVFMARGRLGGTLASPLIFGELNLEKGQLETDLDLVSVDNLSTRLTVNGTSGDIDGRLSVGKGEMTLGGHLDWSKLPPSGTVTMKGSNLDVRYPGIAKARVSPDLAFSLGKALRLEGVITIPHSRIKIKSLPASAVDVSDDARIATDETTETQANPVPFYIDVDLVLEDDLELDAYGLRTGLTGRLALKQEPAKALEAHGEIQLKEGRFHYLGQDLLIKEGKIIFAGPLDHPFLLVDAIRNPESIEDNVTAGVRVSGLVTRPDWEVYSRPDMPQQEQLSYLLRGRGLQGGDDSALQAMLLGLGVSQFGGIATSLGSALGIRDVTLDTEGRGDETRVTIGGYIAPGLRIQYGAGVFGSVSDIRLRYELMPRLYLQAVSGLAQAVDIFYRFSL